MKKKLTFEQYVQRELKRAIGKGAAFVVAFASKDGGSAHYSIGNADAKTLRRFRGMIRELPGDIKDSERRAAEKAVKP